MSLNDLRWVRVRVTGPAARSAREFSLQGSAAMEAAAYADIEFPDLSEYVTPLAKARLLLDSAAEIEQALMVQYLYALFSLRDRNDPALTAEQKKAIGKWHTAIRNTAIEEMGHLMTVENLLLFLRQPTNFEREDFPPRKHVYPFPMHLEPLSQKSLARYIVAESPHDAAGIDDIISQATGQGSAVINRVGILYAILGVIFTKNGELDSSANSGDAWSVSVRDIGKSLFECFPAMPPAEWHLLDAHFDPTSHSRQADSSWGQGSTQVFAVSDRKACLDAIRFISIQGEGMSDKDSVDSHFERFLRIYRGQDTGADADRIIAFPPEGDWLPTRPIPTDPFVLKDSDDPNAIAEPLAVKWAHLANYRYGLLLGWLQQYFHSAHAATEQRTAIQNWCFDGAMRPFVDLNAKLVSLNRRAKAMVKAAMPFNLPEVVNLPDEQESRIALLRRRIARSWDIIAELVADGATDEVLSTIKTADEALLTALAIPLPSAPVEPPEPVEPPKPGQPTTPSPAEAAMLQLIERKRNQAISPHGGVDAGGSALGQLFRDKKFAEILGFLKQGTARIDPQSGKRLIVPGKPEESAYYLHISRPDGVMSGIFDDDDITIVRDWITSLAGSPAPIAPIPGAPVIPTNPNQPKVPDPKRQMLQLLKDKRTLAQNRHAAISTPSGVSLRDLFRNERYDDILAFLESSASVVDPFTGKPLITPGRPIDSAFYLHISDANGVMVGRFNPDEVAIVERWIVSLASDTQGPSKRTAFRSGSKLIVSGLNNPIAIVAAPGDASQLYIAEQRGTIRTVNLNDGTIGATPFLSITDLSSGNEQGLLGLAFHPDFANNRTFYVNCTIASGATEIRSYQAQAGSPGEADPGSKKVLLTVPQPFRNHNGGWIAFGPRDGFLYIALGDGGSANDPQNNAQNLNALLGKLLRINVDSDDFPLDSTRNYAIPPTNPFANIVGARPEVWAYGLRNPWRCSFDRQTGDLYIGDVGQNKREELNVQAASSTGGENYGWRLKEGSLETGLGSLSGLSLVEPIHEYGRTDGFSIIGGYVYRGKQFPAMAGSYFFGDHGGRVWSLVTGKQPQLDDRTNDISQGGALTLDSLSTFGEDANGELYLATLGGDLIQLTAQPLEILESRWSETAKIRIHPAIGIARVGNAGFVGGVPTTPAPSEDFFIGPERPFETSPPSGGYKRLGKVRRQAARFRLYAYDASDNLIGEVTSDIADISWTAELANKKASFRRFTGLSTSTVLRNSSVAGTDRAKLELTPGARTLTGPNQSAAFSGASFTDWQAGTPKTISGIYLGEIQTDEAGRLVVLGGEGTAQSPWNRPITNFANNDGWFDTMADGPVQATVHFKSSGASFAAVPSWVIAAPPKFAPALRNAVTLRDVLFQIAVNKGWLALPDKPSFRYDIYPILYRAIAMQWVLAAAGSNHDPISDSFPPTPTVEPADVFKRLRSPIAGTNGARMNMPQLFDDENAWKRTGDNGLAFTKSMYEMLRRWSIGEYIDDWTGVPPEPSTEITPTGLDQASLENCSGGGFFPGIEAGWMLRDTLAYIEPYRIDPTTLKPGDISRQMAVPWQADFYDCTTTDSDTRRVGWWPQQRPDEVFVEGSPTRQAWIRDKIEEHRDMVDKWHELGFVVFNGTRFVETERNSD